MAYHVYILECRDKTLYIGWTKDLERRVKEHNSGKRGARYTRSRLPVVLKYSDGQYRVSAELMKKLPPNFNHWKPKIKSWKNDLRRKDPEWPPPSLIQTMTDLIFTGNRKEAFDLIHSIWPPDVSGKNDFLTAYEEALKQSNFYPEFEKQLKLLQ